MISHNIDAPEKRQATHSRATYKKCKRLQCVQNFQVLLEHTPSPSARPCDKTEHGCSEYKERTTLCSGRLSPFVCNRSEAKGWRYHLARSLVLSQGVTYNEMCHAQTKAPTLDHPFCSLLSHKEQVLALDHVPNAFSELHSTQPSTLLSMPTEQYTVHAIWKHLDSDTTKHCSIKARALRKQWVL